VRNLREAPQRKENNKKHGNTRKQTQNRKEQRKQPKKKARKTKHRRGNANQRMIARANSRSIRVRRVLRRKKKSDGNRDVFTNPRTQDESKKNTPQRPTWMT
jgi:hypothetical protein